MPYYNYTRTAATPQVLYEINPNVDASGERVSANDRVVSIVPAATFQKTGPGTDVESLDITITPVIGTKMVTADISVTARNLSGFDEQDRPIVETQTFSSTATLKDQQTLHIGTVQRENTIAYRRGIPGLRDIEYVKYLFSVEAERTEKSKMYIIATPTYCNVALYEAELTTAAGAAGNILKVVEGQPELPAFIKDSMLPVRE